MTTVETITCRNCGATGTGKHCYACGQKLRPERITLHSLLHEVVHYFTHLDNGFGYTLKKLIVQPGTMQKEFLDGARGRHQKPFSMFFLCGTIAGLGYYFINVAHHNLNGANTNDEADFFRHYFVLKEAILTPFYSLLIWAVFYNSKRNYAEILVLTLYSLCVVFLALIVINAFKLIFPDYENRYVEIVFLLFYNAVTNLNFFNDKKWIIIIKTILVMFFCFGISQIMTELVVKKIFHY